MQNSNFRIKKLKIHNFKNFKDIDIELNKFNIVIGQNASGKSNFKKIFSFLKDIVTDGLENAIAYQGGGQYIRNVTVNDMSLKMEIHFVSEFPNEIQRVHPRGDYGIIVTTTNIIYKFSLKFTKNLSYKITEDELTMIGSFEDESQKNKTITGKISFSKHGKQIKRKYDFPPSAGSILQRQFELFDFSPLTDKQLLLESKLFGFIVENWNNFLSNIGVYDLEPKLLKSPSNVRSGAKLNYTGSNLSFIIDQIRNDKKKRKVLENYVHDLLPFFKSVSIERTADGSLRFNLKEIYSKKELPAIYASDGTVNILALIIILFLQENRLSVVEEPERNIHPGVLSRLTQLMDETSDDNQVIITTHNSDILDYVDLENILIIIRKIKGNSIIIKPETHEEVKKFKKVMSMKDLMKQNILD